MGARAADRARAARTPQASRTTTASSTRCSPPGSRHSPPCTTGIFPRPLEAGGGWLNRETAYRFADYAALVADALSDRVTHWYTINEPVSTSLQGYAIGELAPRRQLLFESLPTVHHQLLAHGLATRVLRERGATTIGIVNNHTDVRPASESAEDQAAAYVYDILHNRMFAEPVLLGPLSRSRGGRPARRCPIESGDLEIISTPTDVYGFNFYNPTTIAAAPAESPVPFVVVPTPGAAHTGFGRNGRSCPRR